MNRYPISYIQYESICTRDSPHPLPTPCLPRAAPRGRSRMGWGGVEWIKYGYMMFVSNAGYWITIHKYIYIYIMRVPSLLELWLPPPRKFRLTVHKKQLSFCWPRQILFKVTANTQTAAKRGGGNIVFFLTVIIAVPCFVHHHEAPGLPLKRQSSNQGPVWDWLRHREQMSPRTVGWRFIHASGNAPQHRHEPTDPCRQCLPMSLKSIHTPPKQSSLKSRSRPTFVFPWFGIANTKLC